MSLKKILGFEKNYEKINKSNQQSQQEFIDYQIKRYKKNLEIWNSTNESTMKKLEKLIFKYENEPNFPKLFLEYYPNLVSHDLNPFVNLEIAKEIRNNINNLKEENNIKQIQKSALKSINFLSKTKEQYQAIQKNGFDYIKNNYEDFKWIDIENILWINPKIVTNQEQLKFLFEKFEYKPNKLVKLKESSKNSDNSNLEKKLLDKEIEILELKLKLKKYEQSQ